MHFHPQFVCICSLGLHGMQLGYSADKLSGCLTSDICPSKVPNVQPKADQRKVTLVQMKKLADKAPID